MKIYNYDGVTKEYIGESAADPDPLQQGEWLIPANATSVSPPPSVPKCVAIFDISLEQWSYVPDYRGTIVEANDKSGRVKTIEKIGVKPSEVKFEPLVINKNLSSEKSNYIVAILDYLVEPTEEKKEQLTSLLKEILNSAA